MSTRERRTGQRVVVAVAIAAAVSAAAGGLWALAGLPGGLGPVFGAVFAALLVFGGIAQTASRAVRGAARERIEARFPAGGYERATDMASNFGVTSKGVTQLRGNGALVLTGDALHFLALAGADLTVARSAIRGTAIVRSHLGKSVGRALLKVDFDDDSVAFFVEDPQAWRDALAAAPGEDPGTAAGPSQ